MIAIDIFNHFPDQFSYTKTFMSGFVAFMLGILWYHPKIMGEKWVESTGRPDQDSPPVYAYVISFLLWILSAAVYNFLTQFLMPPEIGALLGLSTFLWVGFILPAVMIGGLYMGKKLMVMAIDSSYFLAGLYLFAVMHDVL